MINSHAIASMGTRRGARVGRRHPPPPQKYLWAILGAFLLLFLHMGPFCYVFLILGAFLPCRDLLATFFFMVEAFFRLAPPPYEKFCGRP